MEEEESNVEITVETDEPVEADEQVETDEPVQTEEHNEVPDQNPEDTTEATTDVDQSKADNLDNQDTADDAVEVQEDTGDEVSTDTKEKTVEFQEHHEELIYEISEMKEVEDVVLDEEEIELEHEQEEGEAEEEPDKQKAAQRQSVQSAGDGRRSITYEIGPRIRDDEETSPTGEFVILEETEPFKFYKYLDETDQEEYEEEAEVEEEGVTIDRQPYYEKHDEIIKQTSNEQLKNNILQKKLAKYFKRRKMEYVLKADYQQLDTAEKYGKKLDAYGDLTDLDNLQRTTISAEVNSLKTEREAKFTELTNLFEELQTQEKDTGYGLIHTKTGKPIPDKLVERLINRQRQQMQTVGDMRLRYIQLKNMVAEKQNAISKIDKIGDNLNLMDYEQLKVENRSYMDKMEEKDEELARLRNKCQKTIQILAHMREKSAALESDILDLTDEIFKLGFNSMEVRGQLNRLKQQRDTYRHLTNKMRDESGLLTQSELLRDMDVSIQELQSTTEELKFLIEENRMKAQQIRNIRKNIEFPPEGLIKNKVVSDKKTGGRHLYKSRPSLHKPTLPEDAFKHLLYFRGKPTFELGKKRRKAPHL